MKGPSFRPALQLKLIVSVENGQRFKTLTSTTISAPGLGSTAAKMQSLLKTRYFAVLCLFEGRERMNSR